MPHAPMPPKAQPTAFGRKALPLVGVLLLLTLEAARALERPSEESDLGIMCLCLGPCPWPCLAPSARCSKLTVKIGIADLALKLPKCPRRMRQAWALHRRSCRKSQPVQGNLDARPIFFARIDGTLIFKPCAKLCQPETACLTAAGAARRRRSRASLLTDLQHGNGPSRECGLLAGRSSSPRHQTYRRRRSSKVLRWPRWPPAAGTVGFRALPIARNRSRTEEPEAAGRLPELHICTYGMPPAWPAYAVSPADGAPSLFAERR